MAKSTDRKAKGKAPVRTHRAKGTSSREASPGSPRPDWSPPEDALWVERHPEGHVVMLHHPAHPFRGTWDPASSNLAALTAIADRYLTAADTLLGRDKSTDQSHVVADPWRRDLADSPQPLVKERFELRWLRDSDARHSRRSGADAQTFVLLGGLTLPRGRGRPEPLFGGQGIRVVAHVDPPQAGVDNVRIIGMTSTLPVWSGDAKAAKDAWYPSGGIEFSADALATLGPRIVAAFGLQPGTEAAARGLMVPDAPAVARARGAKSPRGAFYGIATTAPGAKASEPISYRLVSRFDASRKDAEDTGGEPAYREPMVAEIDATALLLKQDPVSQRGAAQRIGLLPSKSWKVLNAGRVSVTLRGLPAGSTAGTVQLADPNGDFVVTNSRLVTADQGLPENAPKEVSDPMTANARTDEFAATSAYYHTAELFARMRRYGLDPATYFAFADRPIRVRYRAGIYPGGLDGRTINAQVWWTLQPGAVASRGKLEVRFALGDLMNSVERSPLGIAADPRWCWHEFSHVLLMAATGQREFAFAHSAGDALAAIVCDPESQLAVDATGRALNDGCWRFVTFPWVDQSRRHDRDVREGWSWTGALYRKELFFAPALLSNKRGYWAEQLLSTSLFRLYRAVGGDTEKTDTAGNPIPDVDPRKAAADYIVYLIMRAIQLAGDARLSPLKTPAQFVAALESADTAAPPAGLTLDYALGTANKVIRWAFERQGLVGLPGPNPLVIGPESTMTVDLHIEDRRDKSALRELGVYAPVNFRDEAWQAPETAVWVRNQADGGTNHQRPRPGQDNFVYVRVLNRGSKRASGTTVTAWWADLLASGEPPPFPDPAAWRPLGILGPTAVPKASMGVPGERIFGPFRWPAATQAPIRPNQRYAILVSATCPTDVSNLATGYAVATSPGAVGLKYVVACDNNLGLRVVTAGP